MRTISYAVLAVGNEWRLVSERHQIGHYANRGLAFAAALRFGEEAARSGCRAEILYADQGGELHTLAMPVLAVDHDNLTGEMIPMPEPAHRESSEWAYDQAAATVPPVAATG